MYGKCFDHYELISFTHSIKITIRAANVLENDSITFPKILSTRIKGGGHAHNHVHFDGNEIWMILLCSFSPCFVDCSTVPNVRIDDIWLRYWSVSIYILLHVYLFVCVFLWFFVHSSFLSSKSYNLICMQRLEECVQYTYSNLSKHALTSESKKAPIHGSALIFHGRWLRI